MIPVPVARLSADGMTLVISRRTPAGTLVATYHRERDAGPFTDADVARALEATPAAGRNMQPGQRNQAGRIRTRFGAVWWGLFLGPPTWWRPRLERQPDGAVAAGWLRVAVAVRLESRRGGNVPGRGIV